MAENPPRIGSSDRWLELYGGRVERLYVGAHVIDQQQQVPSDRPPSHARDSAWAPPPRM
ncbi:MAG TPA: hypothetical protein VIJ51_17695 [Solirubrobacteraceae bacterium]